MLFYDRVSWQRKIRKSCSLRNGPYEIRKSCLYSRQIYLAPLNSHTTPAFLNQMKIIIISKELRSPRAWTSVRLAVRVFLARNEFTYTSVKRERVPPFCFEREERKKKKMKPRFSIFVCVTKQRRSFPASRFNKSDKTLSFINQPRWESKFKRN